MRILLSIVLLITALSAHADHMRGFWMDEQGQHFYFGAFYTLTQTSGNLTITQTMEGHFLQPGDTVSVNPSAVFGLYQEQNISGTALAHIVVKGNGARCTSSFFQQAYHYNAQYVDVINLDCVNQFGQTRFSYSCSNLLFDSCDAIWDATSTRNNGQEWIIFDDPFASVSMVFNGTQAKTFHHIRFTNAIYQGKGDGNLMRFGTNWGGSDDNRSICTDIEVAYCSIIDFRNFPNGINGTPLEVFSGTVFNYSFHHNKIDRVAGAASTQRSHIVVFRLWGNGYIFNNYMDSSYAQLFRLVPLKWTGLAGYGFGCYQWNNIDAWPYSYSMGEAGQNNTGDRNSTFLMTPTNDTFVHNTMYRSVASTYYGAGGTYRYYGRGIDDVNQTPNILFDGYNAFAAPESDFTYNPAIDYSYAMVSSPNANFTSIGNKQVAAWDVTFWTDTISFRPARGSVLENAGASFWFRTSDYFGNSFIGVPDVGCCEVKAENYGTIKVRRRKKN